MNKKNYTDSIPGPLLTTGDIARYCHYTVSQVNRWITKGELKAFRSAGGQYRITREEFRAFLERNNMPVIEEFFQEHHKKKILIADDDTRVVGVISDILQASYEDLELETAYNGYEALICAGDFKPDLLILDIRMPKIDGLEVCRRIRENRALSRGLKILAITAHSEAYDRDTVLAAGADEYLIKPVDMKTLLEHVGKLI